MYLILCFVSISVTVTSFLSDVFVLAIACSSLKYDTQMWCNVASSRPFITKKKRKMVKMWNTFQTFPKSIIATHSAYLHLSRCDSYSLQCRNSAVDSDQLLTTVGLRTQSFALCFSKWTDWLLPCIVPVVVLEKKKRNCMNVDRPRGMTSVKRKYNTHNSMSLHQILKYIELCPIGLLVAKEWYATSYSFRLII